MSWMNSLGGMLQQYAGGGAQPGEAETHFDQVSRLAPPAEMGGALSDMFRSDSTPPFSQQVGQMFGNADNSQKASVLNALLPALGGSLPSILGGLGLSALASKFLPGQNVTPQVAEQLSPEVVQQMADHAEKRDPSIVDRLGSVYAEHPTLVKTLGSAALAITLAKLAKRTNSF